ncbi:ABC transporter permease [Rhodanobacter aciditrophus]|uniref:ABC transporter permease n=1 Tax=Rhodanobacter aciditrophus TaxID=1623218 RepID=A0ABW4AVK8_9GAMM
MHRKFTWFSLTSLGIGLAFLYLPILTLVILSFNDSTMVTVWTHPSTRWYETLFTNGSYWGPAWVTIRIALVASTLAVIMGTLISCVVVRMKRFKTRPIFLGMTIAPLVLPEVITGLSLMLMFTAFHIDRGYATVIIAHTTLAMCFSSVIITARMSSLDLSTEEAARDLGCGPISAFLHATLPAILPAIVSAYLLAFAMSLDNLVMTTFTTGPGITTLPMRIYSEVTTGIKPEINALSSMVILVIAMFVLTSSLVTKYSAKKEALSFP